MSMTQWCCPTISSSATLFYLQSFPASGSFPMSWLFTSGGHWSFSFSISPSNEYSGLISFRMDWLDLLAVQGTLKSLLQHHSSKESVLWCSAFFIVLWSHPYMTIGKTIALSRQDNQAILKCSYTSVQPHHQCMSTFIASHACQHLALWFFFSCFFFLSSWWACSNISL